MKELNPSLFTAEYLQPTYQNKSWYKFIQGDAPTIADGCRNFVESRHLDGMYLDTPLDNVPVQVQAIVVITEIKNAIAPAVIIPNFSDAANYMGMYKHNQIAVEALRRLAPWHFVEVAADTTRFNMARWIETRDFIRVQLDQGNHVIAGIYDPDGTDPHLAAAIAFSFSHENLYWYYNRMRAPSDNTNRPVEFWQWCPLYELAL